MLRGTSDANIGFDDLSWLLLQMDGNRRYEIIPYWSKEDEAFIAEIPELPGCLAHGATPEAALASAKGAMRLWIDTAAESGDPIPAPKERRLIFA